MVDLSRYKLTIALVTGNPTGLARVIKFAPIEI